ncbi:MAG: DNA-processing protein DprA, partial [Lachnospiraceae bacterium]|nr:DNA-processing protein DprA [Lachnospiraceae bacterium]
MVIEKREEQIIDKIADNMLPYAHWLYSIPGIGSKTEKILLSQAGTPKEIYELSCHLGVEELAARLSVHSKKQHLAEKIINAGKSRSIQEEYEALEKKQIHFTCLGHTAYPERLFHIPDAPYGIYFRGKLPAEEKHSIAIIGARKCSEYGRRMAYRFGEELASAGVQIVS